MSMQHQTKHHSNLLYKPYTRHSNPYGGEEVSQSGLLDQRTNSSSTKSLSSIRRSSIKGCQASFEGESKIITDNRSNQKEYQGARNLTVNNRGSSINSQLSSNRTDKIGKPDNSQPRKHSAIPKPGYSRHQATSNQIVPTTNQYSQYINNSKTVGNQQSSTSTQGQLFSATSKQTHSALLFPENSTQKNRLNNISGQLITQSKNQQSQQTRKKQAGNLSSTRQANSSATGIASSHSLGLSNYSLNKRESSVQQTGQNDHQESEEAKGLYQKPEQRDINYKNHGFDGLTEAFCNQQMRTFQEENRCRGINDYSIQKPFANENQNYSSSLVVMNSNFTPEPQRDLKNRAMFSQTLLPNQMLNQEQNFDNDSVNYIQKCQASLTPPSNDVSTNAFSQNLEHNYLNKSNKYRVLGEDKDEPVKVSMMTESPFGRNPQIMKSQFSPGDVSCNQRPSDNSQNTEPQTMTTNTLSELLPFAPSTQYQRQLKQPTEIRNMKSQAAQKAHENQGQMSLSSLNAASNLHQTSFGVSPQMANGRNSLIKANATGERCSFGQKVNVSATKTQNRQASLSKKANQAPQQVKKTNGRPQSSGNLSSAQKTSQGVYSKIGQQINSAIKILEPPSSTSSQGSEQLPKPHPSNQKSSNHQATFDNRQQSKQAGYNGLLLFPKELMDPVQIMGSPSVTDIPLSIQKEIDQLQKQKINHEKENKSNGIPSQIQHSSKDYQQPLGQLNQGKPFGYPQSCQNSISPKSQCQNARITSNNYQIPLTLGFDKQQNPQGPAYMFGNYINQDEMLSNSLLNNSSQYDMKGFLSNRTSCYDRAEMDEKFLDDPNISQCYRVVHHSNQQNMLKEITNLLKGSNQQIEKASLLDSKKDTTTLNDYSITQFNMNALMTPHMNETMTLQGGKDYRPSTHTLIPIDNSSIIYGNCPPSVLSVGEENIQNDESPHKCHSIKAYHISTFFNKDQQMKFLSFLNSQHQLPQFALQHQQYWQEQLQQAQMNGIQGQSSLQYLRAFPKVTFEVPRQNIHENVSVSHYETPINQSMPHFSMSDLTNEQIAILQMNQQDTSMLTGSNLNTSNNPVEVVSSIYGMTLPEPGQIKQSNSQLIPDFGQNNSKRMLSFNMNQTQKLPQNCQKNIEIVQNQKVQERSALDSNNIAAPVKGSHIKLQNCFNEDFEQMDITNELADDTFQEVVTVQVQEQQESEMPQQNHQNSDIHKQHLIQTFNALQTIPLLGPYQKTYLKKERVYLPPPRDPSLKKVLILDIDETMIHCLDERDPESEEPDIVIRIPLDDDEENGEYADAGINIRPHLFDCLRQANQYYQVIAFTASDQQYANAILDYIDPSQTLIQYRLYRQHCIQTEFGYIKDLRVIANRDLKDMVLVDNSVLSFALQLENGIPILPYYVNRSDEELLHLVYYLKCLVEQDDVRMHNKEAFGLNKLAVMDLQQIMSNSSNTNAQTGVMSGEYKDEQCEEQSNNSSNIMQEDEFSDSADMMSPNTKIKNVKQKYQPNEMDQINEDSMESDITSSVISKKVKSVSSLNNFSQKVSLSYGGIQPLQQTTKSQIIQKQANNQKNDENSHSYYHMAQSENQLRLQTKQKQQQQQFEQNQQPQYKHQYLMQLQNQYLHQSSSNMSGRDISSITSSSNAFDNFLGGSIRNDSSSLLQKTPFYNNSNTPSSLPITNLKMK